MRLMLILATVISAFLTITLVFFRATRKTYPGFDRWTTGVGFLTLGYLLICLRGVIPESVSILFGNVAFPLGMVLHLDGLRRFAGIGAVSRLWYALPIIDLAAIAVLYLVHDSAVWRSMVNGIAISAPHWAMAALVFGLPVKRKSMFYPVIGSAIALAGLVVLVRPVGTFFLPEWHLLMDSPFQIGTMIALIVLQLAENLSLIMLNSERVENELMEAEAELRRSVERLQLSLDEQKRTEESLRQSEERYRTFFDTSRDCVFITTLDGRFIDFNDAGLEMLGYSPGDRQEILKKDVASFYANPEEREAHSQMVAAMGFSKEYPVDLRKKDGTIIHALVTTVARKGPDGNVIGFQGTVRDITERKQAEEALRQSEEKFRSLFESSLDGILLTAPDGTVFHANPAACQILGWSEQELREIGRDGVVDRTDPRLSSALAERNRTGRFSGELNLKRKDGATFPAELSSALFVTANDNLRANIVIRDISERKRVEEALRQSEEKYRLLVDKAQEAIFVVQDTVFRFVNPRLEEILGFSADELIGKSFAGFVHPDNREMVVEKHYRRMKGEVFPSRYEIRIIDKQKSVKWAELDSVVIDWAGKPAALVFLVDITHKKLAEEATVQAERLRAIADISAGVAHHFNNLLQIIIGSTSLSLFELESGDPTEVKPTLEKMLVAATLGAETVRRLQTFANVRSDITEGEAATFDIAATARNAAEISKPLWKAEPEKRGTKVNLQLHLDEGFLVFGKENEIFEALVNLISNAAEAMPDGGDIEVRAAREAEEVVVTVRDSGIGIAEEDLPKIFQPFWSNRGVGIGKGMGLAVTHGLVKRHGGTISVQSRMGEGSIFTIRLPLARKPLTETEPPSEGSVADRLTILAIDDESHVATLLERMLAKAGHRVFKAFSGKEGLAVINKERLDMVICDLGMPGMSGWEVGKTIRTLCEQEGVERPLFVLLTGWGDQELETEKIAESGVDAVIAKPIDSAALLATVQRIARRFSTSPNGNQEEWGGQ